MVAMFDWASWKRSLVHYISSSHEFTKLKAGVIQECSENEADKMHRGHAWNSDCQRCWFLQLTLTHISQPAYRYSSRALLLSAVTSQNLAPCTSQWAHYGGRGVGQLYPAWPPSSEASSYKLQLELETNIREVWSCITFGLTPVLHSVF